MAKPAPAPRASWTTAGAIGVPVSCKGTRVACERCRQTNKKIDMRDLDGLRVAVLVADGFEQVEMVEPKRALEQAGAQAKIVSPVQGEVQGWNHFDKADKFKVDVPLDQARADEFDALLLPGGVANPDQLRMKPKAVEFVRSF